MKINKKDHLYVIDENGGYSCLGYHVCERRIKALADEMGMRRTGAKIGTQAHYREYISLCEEGRRRNVLYGWRSQSQLTPEFIGLEGKRVEVDSKGNKRRFYIGRSTGWCPVHLEISRKDSMGGPAVCMLPGDTFRVIGER